MAATSDARIGLRISPADRGLFEKAASAVDETIPQFLVAAGLERAKRVLAERTEFALDAVAWESIEEAMDRPASVIPDLERLFDRPRPE